MRVRRIGVALAGVAIAAIGLTACGSEAPTSVVDKAQDQKKLIIGVKYDQPGLGLKQPDGTVAGFDVDVAKYVAQKLGVPESGVTFKETRSANREQFIQTGQVDLVIATYSITAERKGKVTFGGPYYVAHQDIMVRADDTSIKTVDDLKGKNLCQVAGSNSWKNIIEGKKVAAELVPANAYDECMTKIKGGTIDAVSTDDAILAGYAAREGGAFKVVSAPFTDEKYGVGMKKGDLATCDAVNKAITDMYNDGTAKRLLEKNFGPSKFKYTETLPQFEGCS